ncbi:hypothetical protein [Paenacidovorax monticola]|uniref:Uncharacterized protein n=1 Tax=Paenacidovorax monticola TaxID=1926868 RepID=A0A7H0HHQ3_9BURK|nr:hypothetical protein [Paenacidovorax monticola]QNP60069.1 hypothetical protein H9L24_03875 [Paenacidovorax monticola]
MKKRKKSFRNSVSSPAGRTSATAVAAEQQRMNQARHAALDRAFRAACEQVLAVLRRVHPVDALAALNVCDLWQPNRASPYKHQMAFGLLISQPAQSFASSRLSCYEDFRSFCEDLQQALPALPMLEDMTPEADWGDIKVLRGTQPQAILHGGPIQRLADHIEAFCIGRAENSQAVAELDAAIGLQAELLQRVPHNASTLRGQQRSEETALQVAAKAQSLQHANLEEMERLAASVDREESEPWPGHLEVPPREFWDIAMPALQRPFQGPALEASRMASLGQACPWSGFNGFGNAIMAGTALPWALVHIDGCSFGVCLRNVVTVVIDAWAEVDQEAPWRVAARLGAYIAKRIPANNFLPGPMMLRTQQERTLMPIAAVLSRGSLNILVVPVTPTQWPYVHRGVAELKRVMRNPNWGLQRIGTSEGYQLGNLHGSAPGPQEVYIVLVTTKVSTQLAFMRNPAADTQLMPLVDACTIFDVLDSVEELERFWTYVEDLRTMGGTAMNDLGDLFGSFRDSHGQIVDGAVVPTFLALDPHWGASWRHQQQQTYWAHAPRRFPDEESAWQTHPDRATSSLRHLTAKNAPRIAWCSQIGECTVFFLLNLETYGLEQEHGSLLHLFMHCAADCLAERAGVIEPHLQLPWQRLRLHCVSAPHLLPQDVPEPDLSAADLPLITDWEETGAADGQDYEACLTINLVKLQQELETVEDASFEASCATVLTERLFSIVGGNLPDALRAALAATAARQPRFTLTRVMRTVDVPDHVEPLLPRPEAYKVARRELAYLLKAQGVNPGTYHLDEGKVVINGARAQFRNVVHQRIRALDRDSLLRYCVTQYDAVIAKYDAEERRIQQSLRHQVDFNREQQLAEANDTFSRESRNLRYLIECAVVIATPQAVPVRAEDVLPIHAMVDWLHVFYGASDMLHNDIDVGGLRLNSEYVPEVYYSDSRDEKEQAFRREHASLRLGVNVSEEDQLTGPRPFKDYLTALDAAFAADVQFTFSDMWNVLGVLMQWVAVGGNAERAFGYSCDRQTLAERVVQTHQAMSEDATLAVIDFLVLAPDQVWQLIGIELPTDDVPVWEHAKRTSRHTIRPLLALTDGRLLWGAAAAERARRIWGNSLQAGFLPADYAWPAVRAAVGQYKKELEDGLEDKAYEVFSRCLPHTLKGINFKDRFPRQGFPNVGDYDVLAYQPEHNEWFTVECKYNQPAFSMKDTRRLRDRIFGGGSERGQLRKIEGRREFLIARLEQLRGLLGWPAPPADRPFKLTELYVSKDMHFWLRFPPYPVPTQFVQLDTLDAWLRRHLSIEDAQVLIERHEFGRQ